MKLSITEIFNKIPNRQFKNTKIDRAVQWVGRNISTPENRLIIGVSALLSQPFIDLYNKDVDEKTRKISCARTIAKIVAGTVTGTAVRYGFIYIAKNFSHVGQLGEKKITKSGKEIIITKAKKFFTPPNATTDKTYEYKQYQNTIGTALSIIAMIFTNFLIDMTFTTFLTNVLIKKIAGVDKSTLTPQDILSSKTGGAK